MDMTYRNLGNSGLKVSTLSFGSWVTFDNQLDVKGAAACLKAAFDAGVNFFDNAEVYAGGNSERVMGLAIKHLGLQRDELVLSTKIFWGGPDVNQRGLSRKHLIEGTAASLKRMGVEYVDLLFCHRPDPETPIEETVRAMNHIIDRGWAFYWGTSEWSAEQIRQAHEVAKNLRLIGPTMEQPQYHLLHRQRVEVEYAPLYRDFGLGLTTWSPLASGLLTGKYNDGIPKGSRLSLEGFSWLKDSIVSDPGYEQKLSQVQALSAISKELGCTQAQLAIAWCTKNEHVSTVITGASRLEQVTENLKALSVADQLDDALLKKINTIIAPPAPAQNWRAR